MLEESPLDIFLSVDQDPGGHPSGASLKTEVPQASQDQEASEPDPSKNSGLNGECQRIADGKIVHQLRVDSLEGA